MSVDIPLLTDGDRGFEDALARLLERSTETDARVVATVAEILADVRRRGDAAVLEHTRRLDRHPAESAAALEVPRARLEDALAGLAAPTRTALETAAGRIRAFHERQRAESWRYEEPDGTLLGQQVTPLERVGLYAPGGRAAYPSSVLMNAIPAKVAGVDELVMVSPAPAGELDDNVLAAAALAGVDRYFAIGGAQAVAALAFGTETVPRVDKIVGPGNAWVAEAKRQVYGRVAIDMIAGPSEVLVLCDGATDPEWVALDLFAQAEHGPDSQALLVTWAGGYAAQVKAAIDRLIGAMDRRDDIVRSLEERGALITVANPQRAIELANRIAPEHLELSVEEPLALAPRIRHAGAIFLGRHAAEALGDYCAGPNHVLPTSGTARFSSPLGVYDFQKRTSLLMCPPAAAARLGRVAAELARAEGLQAHALSAEARYRKPQ
jgi:histidinol dehydrogenase